LKEVTLDNGRSPAIATDANNQPHLAYCAAQELVYQFNAQPERVSAEGCLGRPALALDNQGQPHVVWYGVTGVTGLLCESTRPQAGQNRPSSPSPRQRRIRRWPLLAALIQAMKNGAHVRVLVKPDPFEGIENTIALTVLQARLEELGLEDRFEFRYFNGPVHPKVFLIDEQVLVGSQNFHYSAFGVGGGLNEYSIALEDPQATADFQSIFEVVWAAGSLPVVRNR
jgi:hypothetical protein